MPFGLSLRSTETTKVARCNDSGALASLRTSFAADSMARLRLVSSLISMFYQSTNEPGVGLDNAFNKPLMHNGPIAGTQSERGGRER